MTFRGIPQLSKLVAFAICIWDQREHKIADVLAVKVFLVLFPKTSFPEMRIFLGIYQNQESLLFPLAIFSFSFQ